MTIIDLEEKVGMPHMGVWRTLKQLEILKLVETQGIEGAESGGAVIPIVTKETLKLKFVSGSGFEDSLKILSLFRERYRAGLKNSPAPLCPFPDTNMYYAGFEGVDKGDLYDIMLEGWDEVDGKRAQEEHNRNMDELQKQHIIVYDRATVFGLELEEIEDEQGRKFLKMPDDTKEEVEEYHKQLQGRVLQELEAMQKEWESKPHSEERTFHLKWISKQKESALQGNVEGILYPPEPKPVLKTKK